MQRLAHKMGTLCSHALSGVRRGASALSSSARVGPLTAANTLRHNRAQAAESADNFNNGTGATGVHDGRQPMLNPLVHAFASPIGEV